MDQENKIQLPENLQNILYSLVEKYEEEDSWVRKQQIKMWKKNHEFWHGIQYIFWSETRQDWFLPTDGRFAETEEGREGAQGPFYDFAINIFKAHGESIISALSSKVPSVRFPPDDADDQNDLLTSETYSKIAQLIQRHNPSKKLIMEALFNMWNEGIVFSYVSPQSDRAFGTLEVPQFGEVKRCEACGYQSQMEDEEFCPECAQAGIQSSIISTSEIIGYEEVPKTRALIELYGGLFVKVSYYAKEQKNFPYLFCTVDQPLALLKSLYPEIADKIDAAQTDLGQYERMGRNPDSYSVFSQVNETRNLRPLKRCWFRPWVFDGLGSDLAAEKQQLKEFFPDGCCVVFIGKTYAESRNENLDKYWTVGQAGLSRYIHADPLGQPLIPVQELRNVLVNLTVETIEHGIPSSFADPEVLDFDTYSKHEARPGMIYPAAVKPGMSMQSAFYESSRSTLSQEVGIFADRLDSDGQFVTGSFPSIYGGPNEGSSRTASEYAQSRDMALQRLSICWHLLNKWWGELMEKAVKIYIESMVTDEHFVIRKNDSYQNVYIRQSEMSGKVGDVEVESSDQFPQTLSTKKQVLLDLLNLNNESLNEALFDPANRKNIAQVLGYTDLFIPGESQLNKQMREIQELIQGIPVAVEPDIDDNEIHIEALVNYLTDSVGLDLKKTNPQGYALCVQHLKEHRQLLMIKEMTENAPIPSEPTPDGQPQ